MAVCASPPPTATSPHTCDLSSVPMLLPGEYLNCMRGTLRRVEARRGAVQHGMPCVSLFSTQQIRLATWSLRSRSLARVLRPSACVGLAVPLTSAASPLATSVHYTLINPSTLMRPHRLPVTSNASAYLERNECMHTSGCLEWTSPLVVTGGGGAHSHLPRSLFHRRQRLPGLLTGVEYAGSDSRGALPAPSVFYTFPSTIALGRSIGIHSISTGSPPTASCSGPKPGQVRPTVSCPP